MLYTAEIIGAVVLIVLALTVGLTLAFNHERSPKVEPTVEPPHVIPQHGPYDWETTDYARPRPPRNVPETPGGRDLATVVRL